MVRGEPKNRTHTIFIQFFTNPVNFKHFAGFKLQSVHSHSPKVPVIEVPLHKSHICYKICSKWPPWHWRQACIHHAKLSITQAHSSLGISLILAVIAAFNSPIVRGLFWYTLPLRYPHR